MRSSGDYVAMTASSTRTSLLGLFSRRERWSLSRRGWLLVFLLVGGSTALIFFRIHPFLAVTRRVDSDVLVVEGWIPDPAFKDCIAEFNTHPYRKVFTTGGPVQGRGPVSQYKTFAPAGFVALAELGLPRDRLQSVPAHLVNRDRTYSSAVALREWYRENHFPVRSLNVITSDVHARRTRLLFQKAFGSGVAVGIISLPSDAYPANDWYRYSEGVKEVI